MKTVLLYRVVIQEVEFGDHFTFIRTPGFVEPLHSLGDGNALAGVRQMPLEAVRPCAATGEGGAYIALAPSLRALLEAPIRAEAAREIQEHRAAAWAYLASGPWYVRLWRALLLRKAPALHSIPA